MKERMKKIKLPALIILGFALIAVVAYAGARTYKARQAGDSSSSLAAGQKKPDIYGALITTSFGSLKLIHDNGETSLDGTLSRSTPCVNWNVAVNKIDTAISISISDANKAEICVQSLGTPQPIHASIIDTSPKTTYVVNLEEATVYQGTLDPVTLPQAPTGGVAQ